MIRTAIITLSDKGAAGEREDESGKVIREMVASVGASVEHNEILPDDKDRIIRTLSSLADSCTVRPDPDHGRHRRRAA